MRFPKRINLGMAMALAFISWFIGWNYSDLWSNIYFWLHANVWQPYIWLWDSLIWIFIIAGLGSIFAMMFYLYWKTRNSVSGETDAKNQD